MGGLSLATQRHVFRGRDRHECPPGGVEHVSIAWTSSRGAWCNHIPKEPYWLSRTQCRSASDQSFGLSNTNRAGMEKDQQVQDRPELRRGDEETARSASVISGLSQAKPSAAGTWKRRRSLQISRPNSHFRLWGFHGKR